MCFQEWLLKYQGIVGLITLGVIIIALIPIFREWKHKKRFTRVLRAKLRVELSELIASFSDKIRHINHNPKLEPVRKFKYEDLQIIDRLEKLFEDSTYLTYREFKIFDILMIQYRAYTFLYQRKAIDKPGLISMRKTADLLRAYLYYNLIKQMLPLPQFKKLKKEEKVKSKEHKEYLQSEYNKIVEESKHLDDVI